MKKVEELRRRVQELMKSSEHRSQKLHGISLTRAELENISDLCDLYIEEGNFKERIIFANERAVLTKCGIL